MSWTRERRYFRTDSLEKQKGELSNIRLDLASKLEDFESRRDQDVSEEKLKEYRHCYKMG